ncbi:MAG: hypothetical protein AAB605_02240 [Patescibacteria group bacterium]
MKPARMAAVRKKKPTRERLKQAIAKSQSKSFYVRDNRVFFRNRELLFAGDPPSDAPEKELLKAYPIEGGRNAMTAKEVARFVANILNRAVPA